jgi:hypothetical protein
MKSTINVCVFFPDSTMDPHHFTRYAGSQFISKITSWEGLDSRNKRNELRHAHVQPHEHPHRQVTTLSINH